MVLDHSRLGLVTNLWTTNQAEFFAFDKFTLQNRANKSGGELTNLLYLLYITSELKKYYEALYLSFRPQKDAVFHNFSRQIALSQYSGRSIVGF